MTLRCKSCLHSPEAHPIRLGYLLEPRPCEVIECLCNEFVPWWDWR